MAALTRAFLPQLHCPSIRSIAKSTLESSRSRIIARYTSRISKLQPVFPETRDETLFEPASEEYARTETEVPSPLQTIEDSISDPSDHIFLAVKRGNFVLADALLREAREQKIDVAFRVEYEHPANERLERADFSGFMEWLSLVPPVGVDGVLFPKNTRMVAALTKDRLPFDRLTILLSLFARKGWSGPVPAELITILAKYTSPLDFGRIFPQVLTTHARANQSSEDVRWIHAEWRNRAIRELAKRNLVPLAFGILRQSPEDTIQYEPSVSAALSQAARLTNTPIPAFAQDYLGTHRGPPIPKRDGKSEELSKLAFRISVHLKRNTTKATYEQSPREVARILRPLKAALTSQTTETWPDTKAVSYLFYCLGTYANRPRLMDLFRRRVTRLGNFESHRFWATVEVDYLCLIGQPHSALIYYTHAFLPISVPPFIRGQSTEFWDKWRARTPLHSPSLVSLTQLRPAASSIMAVWRCAISLSLRDPEDEHMRSFGGDDEDGVVVVDTSTLDLLFRQFLGLFDRASARGQTFFANPHTRVRFAEIFLRKYVQVAPPEKATWAMQQIQQRDIQLDHRIWAIYAKSKMQHGQPGFLLQVFELLQRDMEGPLDFSPTALKDFSGMGMRKADGGGAVFTIPVKVLNAYTYGLKTLLDIGAHKEALALHGSIMRAGYREGTSLSLDRIVFRMVTELRQLMLRIGGPEVKGPKFRATTEFLDDLADEKNF